MNIVVLDGAALNPGDLSWACLEEIGEVTVYPRTPPEEVDARIRDAQIVLTNKTPIRKANLEKAQHLRYIGVMATGFDCVDAEDAGKRGIPVSNVPTYGTDSVAQLTFALLLELVHGIAAHNELVRSGGWSGEWSLSLRPFRELRGMKMGILGLGRIGQAVAALARAFGMEVLGLERGKALEGVTFLPWEEFFRRADVISLHMPLTDESRGIIRRDTLALMKPTALLLNTARGALINEKDLAEALNRGIIAGAGVDVLSSEPNTDSPLLKARNIVFSPHRAWSAREARGRLMEQICANIRSWLAGEPDNLINR